MRKFALLFFILFSISIVYGQQAAITGQVVSMNGTPLSAVNISVPKQSIGTVTNQDGNFNLSIELSDSVLLKITHVGYLEKLVWVHLNDIPELKIQLQESTQLLDEVKVNANREEMEEPSVIKLNPKSLEALPTPFRDFNKILVTLPGVVSNNELSSTYAVRGGNFDENLVYVNDIPIYRPFLVTNGQQEGLSFINSDMVESVKFSAGGWQAKYGDKLSSVLNVNYAKPDSFGLTASASLLGGTIHLEGTAKNGQVNYSLGVRHKSSKYLLNTLETQGQYLPKFTDYQSFLNFNLGKSSDPKKTTLGILTSYARNRYLVEPESRETEFGNFNKSLRLFIAFEGKEVLEYDTYQGGIKLAHRFSDNWKTQLVASGVYALEREYTDVEGGYRLCDVDKNLSSSTFNDCAFIRGVGTNYDYGRNNLKAEIINLENRHIVLIQDNIIELGFGYSSQQIEDQLQEYSFTDSADYVTTIDAVQSSNRISSDQYTGYIQSTIPLSNTITSTVGARLNYWSLNSELLVSPRGQIIFNPKGKRTSFSGAIGLYQQPPFFREMRDFNGNLNTNLKAQKSIHFILGSNYNFTWWGRPFLLSSELYYKLMKDIVPYEVDNVKVRYYANNDAEAYAMGLDMRISGEFIEGAESWFSLGLMNVREDVAGDNKGYIRRPTDQRVTLAVFFQDHLPNNPNIRVNLNLLYGSGLPFGAPGNFEERNKFNGRDYKRIDVGFSRVFPLKGRGHSLVLNAEILNLLGTNNAISYTWISDVNNNQYAVPNSLSARFLNIRLTVKL